MRNGLLFAIVIAGISANAAANELAVEVVGDHADAEICRFAAGSGTTPFDRWLKSQELVCQKDRTLSLPAGRWNLFARAAGFVSPSVLVDTSIQPRKIQLDPVPAATVDVHPGPGLSAVLYSTRHVTAVPAAPDTRVPAGEETWLLTLRNGKVAGITTIAALEAGARREVDAVTGNTPALLGWIELRDADRRALLSAHGVNAPKVTLHQVGHELESSGLPSPELLDGALLRFDGVARGNGEMKLSGRGWLQSLRPINVGTESFTLVREPLAARPAAFLAVNWSTGQNLAALDRSFGFCPPHDDAMRFQMTISSCPAPPPGEPADPAACHAIRTEALRPEVSYGVVTVGEVPPGLYRAEIVYGKLPPISSMITLEPLDQRPLILPLEYVEAYGNLTLGDKPLEDDMKVVFPSGSGFSAAESGEYHAVLSSLPGVDTKIDVNSCAGDEPLIFLTDKPMRRGARYDIDIPANLLTLRVVDTFTRMRLDHAVVHCSVMSASFPRRVVLTTTLKRDPKSRDSDFVLRSVPERDLRIEVTHPGYKKKELAPFSLTRNETKEIEVELMPLSGAEGRVVSSKPFENATIAWFTADGAETERADLAPDGAFYFERLHGTDETIAIISSSHPLWVLRSPQPRRAEPLQLMFPATAPVRIADVTPPEPVAARLAIAVGLSIGGLRVPQSALADQLALRRQRPLLYGDGPATLRIPDILETGRIDVLLSPLFPAFAPPGRGIDAIARSNFAPAKVGHLQPGGSIVTFDTP